MKLETWLATLSDDYLTTWGNKGQLRRGKKLAATGDGEFASDQHGASAQFDGFLQRLDGVGFEKLTCTCPAAGVCHHLMALLVTLRDTVPGSQLPVDAASHHAGFWRTASAETLVEQLGRGVLNQSLAIYAKDHPSVRLQESATELLACVELDTPHTVRFPRTGTMDMSVCSCKRATCVHRGLALIALRDDLAASREIASITEDQVELLGLARDWLISVMIDGQVAITDPVMQRATALARELRQADTPNAATDLGRIARTLAMRQDILTSSEPSEAIARFWLTTTALVNDRTPRPTRELLGQHKRDYRRHDTLDLVGIGSELWATPSGYEGFSIHFLDETTGTPYSLSEARNASHAGSWRAPHALRHAAFGGQPAARCAGSTFNVRNAWLSPDGRLSLRDDSSVRLTGERNTSSIVQLAISPNDIRPSAHHHFPVSVGPSPIACLVRVRLSHRLEFDRFSAKWTHRIASSLVVATDKRDIADRLNLDYRSVQALYCVAYIERAQTRIRPISAVLSDTLVPLTHDTIGATR
ncbi:MAG: hypothetical protein AAF493_00195 [Pseudomonadota bacterium]